MRAGVNANPQAPMTQAASAILPRIVGFRVPPGGRRTPFILARVAFGPVDLAFSVARLKRGELVVRPPLAADGGSAVAMSAEVEAEVSDMILAAVAAAPEMQEHLVRLS